MNTTDMCGKVAALVHSGQLKFLPLVVLAPAAVFYVCRVIVAAVRYVVADRQVRPMLRRV